MTRDEAIKRITQSGVIGVMRGMQAGTTELTARALYAGGVEVLEVTVDAPGAMRLIADVTEALGDKALIGAGTVLDAETARAALLAGAQFIFCPTLNVDVISMANRYGKIAIPGVMTPTEMLQAYTAGAPMVKLFPAQAVGPDFIKQVRGPLPYIPIVPTGGVNADNVQAYVKAGAAAVGIGGALVDLAAIQAGRYELLTKRAQEFVRLVAEARQA
ncbi:MAG: bifunctional 4-hydroxy-2-oxoglutarate aldolase/2-dehydro-3-deoxy-phosphogluconate aldolase [Limnochordia bacterium]